MKRRCVITVEYDTDDYPDGEYVVWGTELPEGTRFVKVEDEEGS